MAYSSYLLADIGGTSIRLAVSTGNGARDLRIYATADFTSIEAVIRAYLETQSDVPRLAALAMANPVDGDVVRMTNRDLSFSVSALRAALGLDALLVVNDFSALAQSIPHLQSDELRAIGAPRPQSLGPIGVVGPGTGLGMSGLIPTHTGWLALSSEGGHASLAPANAFEAELLRLAWRHHPHVSLERFLSGPGLRLLYELVCENHGVAAQAVDAGEITARAQRGECAESRHAIDTFCDLLATAAGNLALTLGARGGIYIGGGIVPKLGTLLDGERFRARFEDHGRFGSYLARIPTLLITAPCPALRGLEAMLTAWLTHGTHAPLPLDRVLAQRALTQRA